MRPIQAKDAAAKLRRALAANRGDLTVADAAARGALTLREAEDGLLVLSSEYRGHMKATDKGELLFSFPDGFRKTGADSAAGKLVRAVSRSAVGVGRFVVRAWVSVVMVGYALVLVGVVIALAARSDDNDGIGDSLGGLLQGLAEALYWTFHPFSPVSLMFEPVWMRPRMQDRTVFGRRRMGPAKIPFYEKVNRFAFGPAPKKVDPREQVAMLLAEIRRLQGRVGVGDVMRVTGLAREDASAVLARMVVDYEGELAVSDEPAIVYRFPALRLTAKTAAPVPTVPAVWTQQQQVRPLTGNPPATNFLLGAINAFNLAASGFILANHLTVERILQLFGHAGERMDPVARAAAEAAASGTPVVLGVIPFVFSALMFALPVGRTLGRRREVKRVARENGRRGLLQAILGAEGGARGVMPAGALAAAWKAAAGRTIVQTDLTAEVRELGGEPDVDDAGRLIYRFDDLAREGRSLEKERRAASSEELRAGDVIFSSKD